jgi:hypothetical protein
MTETELEALRDSLVSLNTELDVLDSRVTALENLAVPKGDYFNQLKASFEGSPECCECSGTAECVGGTPTVSIYGDSDGLPHNNLSFVINGVAVATLPAEIERTITTFAGVDIGGRFYDRIVTYTNIGTTKINFEITPIPAFEVLVIADTNTNETAILSVDSRTLTACLAIQ